MITHLISYIRKLDCLLKQTNVAVSSVVGHSCNICLLHLLGVIFCITAPTGMFWYNKQAKQFRWFIYLRKIILDENNWISLKVFEIWLQIQMQMSNSKFMINFPIHSYFSLSICVREKQKAVIYIFVCLFSSWCKQKKYNWNIACVKVHNFTTCL